jgi:predicted outer membrane repeat protein
MKTALSALIFLLALTGGSQAATFIVRADGLGITPDIQTAVDQSFDGDHILLIAGVFTGSRNRDIRIGGRNIGIRSFDNEPSTCIIDCGGSPGEPHRAFISSDEDCQTSAIVSITMRNGYSPGGGGAMLIIGYSSLYVSNCVFEDNATGMTDWNGGGAVYADRTGTPIFTDCVFRNNQAFAGGALNSNHGGRVTLNNCQFIGNRAIKGGAIYGKTTAKIGCLFADNEAVELGGAIWHNASGLDYYESCTFDGNRAPDGSALFASSNYGGPVEMVGTIFSNHEGGRALAISPALVLTMSCCNLYGNEGGDWIAPFAAQVDERGNFSANPCYCDPEGEDFHLSEDSYTRAGGHPWGCDQLVGAYGVGCGAIGCSGPVDVDEMNFGSVKSLYR